eukprot:NODE_4462_length_672_cov_279.873582.p2 GENE.NODE_4462_length_672_cov_279.873582~~NODE_4462_length_672_cov_279.873582.p2  ORF type:complete len:180 (+),score=53.01 NODE_4462_length_672_cov_279.873582:3-542(+)
MGYRFGYAGSADVSCSPSLHVFASFSLSVHIFLIGVLAVLRQFADAAAVLTMLPAYCHLYLLQEKKLVPVTLENSARDWLALAIRISIGFFDTLAFGILCWCGFVIVAYFHEKKELVPVTLENGARGWLALAVLPAHSPQSIVQFNDVVMVQCLQFVIEFALLFTRGFRDRRINMASRL